MNSYLVTFNYSQYLIQHSLNDPEGKKTTICRCFKKFSIFSNGFDSQGVLDKVQQELSLSTPVHTPLFSATSPTSPTSPFSCVVYPSQKIGLQV